MRLKSSLFLLLFSLNVFALTEIPGGVSEMEVKVLIEDNQVYLSINHGTHSAAKIKLVGDTSVLKDQNQSNGRLEVKLKETILDSEGEAEFIKLVRFLHPAEDPKVYREKRDFN